jgi:exonuclease SbcC
MSEERKDQNGEDEMTNALSALGWVEERDEESPPVSEDENLQEQLNLALEKIKELTEQIDQLNDENDNLRRNSESLFQDKEKALKLANENNSTVENLLKTIVQKDEIIKSLEEKINNLDQTAQVSSSIVEKNEEIKVLKSQIEEKNQEIESKLQEISNLKDSLDKEGKALQNLDSELKVLKTVENTNKELSFQLKEKDTQINELSEQLKYLESDTIQKSKFEKIQILAEKKDEIITEKEKVIFGLENNLNASNQTIKDLQHKLETFTLAKKDLGKKEERINELVLEIEKITQKNKTNEEFMTQLQTRLEESQEKSGNITGKFELEMANLRNIIDDQTNEIKRLRENETKLQNKLYETEQIEDRILTEMQQVKDEKLKLESQIETKEEELIDLKKKIKLMRRDLKKT